MMPSIARGAQFARTPFKKLSFVMIMCLTAAGGVAADTLAEIVSSAKSRGDMSETEERTLSEALKPYIANDNTTGQHNRVLNEMEVGLVAFELGYYEISKSVLQDAYASIETIYSDSPSAEKARSVFTAESAKDFKGEAYERAMVGYYLGLSYMMLGDLDNARASFKWGQFQDSLFAANSGKLQSDFASLEYLTAWVDRCGGDAQLTSQEAFADVNRLRPALLVPANEDNLLLIAELGNSPVKQSDGKYNENLYFAPGVSTDVVGARAVVGGSTLAFYPAEDLYFQASTQGGRAVDKILAGKASFKDTANTVADVAGGLAMAATTYSQIQAMDGKTNSAIDSMTFGLGSLLLSGVSKHVSDKAKPEADARFWSTLPNSVQMATGHWSDFKSSVTASFVDKNGMEIKVAPVQISPTKACYLGWAREVTSVPERVAGSHAGDTRSIAEAASADHLPTF